MKYCSYCGKEVAEGARFCGSCGKELAISYKPQAVPERKSFWQKRSEESEKKHYELSKATVGAIIGTIIGIVIAAIIIAWLIPTAPQQSERGEGTLQITVNSEDGTWLSYKLYIDGELKEVVGSTGDAGYTRKVHTYMLTPGSHTIKIVPEDGASQIETVNLPRGGFTPVSFYI